MKTRNQWFLLALQIAVIISLLAKYTYDRHHYPRIWVRTTTYDPSMVVRGRYVALNLEVVTGAVPTVTEHCSNVNIVEKGNLQPDPKRKDCWEQFPYQRARIEARNGQLFAVPDAHGPQAISVVRLRNKDLAWVLSSSVPYFIPEHAWDPLRHGPNEELWAEVTVLPKGPPRVIQLAIKRDDIFKPLKF